MEGTYGVYFGKELVGKVQVTQQGLYYRFICRCRLTGNVICRLRLTCGTQSESLGIVVPVADGFGLDTKLPVKRMGAGNFMFSLIPRHENSGTEFIPIISEEPFAYIQRLKTAYLVKKEGMAGIIINT